MKKIGIITFHDAISYGATMQCLGLQEYIRSIGYDPIIIDYSITAYTEERNKHKIKTVINKARKLFAHPIKIIKLKINAKKIKEIEKEYENQIKNRNQKFFEFRNSNYSLSEKRYDLKSELKKTPPICDAYICGSDQIWNPNFCDFDSNYFLDFAARNKRIAYAPSFGVSVFPKGKKRELLKRIQEFECLSIREESGAAIIKSVCNREVPVVIDPTFLLDTNKWCGYAEKSDCNIAEKFILTYFIGYDSYIENAQVEIAKHFKGYKIIDLVFDKTDFGPQDFLYLIKNAEYIVTNSFHGCAFCIIFEKQFSVIKTVKDFIPGSAFSRIDNMLNLFNLRETVLQEKNKFNIQKIDYINVNKIKKEVVKESREYLKKSILTVSSN